MKKSVIITGLIFISPLMLYSVGAQAAIIDPESLANLTPFADPGITMAVLGAGDWHYLQLAVANANSNQSTNGYGLCIGGVIITNDR